jgi:hypothetical protein
MIPVILTAIGAYLIGDSIKDKKVFAEGGSVNYLKRWKAIYITFQGKKGVKEITLGRLSDKEDVKQALRRMPDLNIREVTSIEEIKENDGDKPLFVNKK